MRREERFVTLSDRWTGWPDAFPMTMHGDTANAKACAKTGVSPSLGVEIKPNFPLAWGMSNPEKLLVPKKNH